ncbi:MAG: tetratricopeptide repeat protein [Bacteroidota bacterium]
MAKKTNQEETIVDVQEVFSKTELFIDKNRSKLAIVIGALVLVVLGVIAYKQFVVNPKESKAQEAVWKAEQYASMDSLDLALDGDGLYDGFVQVAREHAGTKAASRANFYLGTISRDREEFDAAIDYFKKVEFKDDVIGPMASGNIGDCLVESGKVGEAIPYFEEAAMKAMNGKGAGFVAPLYLHKAAIANMDQGNNDKAEKHFRTIVDNYPEAQNINDAKKYLAMLEAQNG